MKKENDDVKTTHINNIKFHFKKEELAYIHETHFSDGEYPTSWEVGEKLGLCKGNTVFDNIGFTVLTWQIKTIKKAMSVMDTMAERYSRSLTYAEMLDILDSEYDRFVDDLATQWVSLTRKKY